MDGDAPGFQLVRESKWRRGADQLFFGDGSGIGLEVGQLSQIKFYSDAGTTILPFAPGFSAFKGGFGEVVPVPEPGSVATAMGLLGLIGWRERRRRARENSQSQRTNADGAYRSGALPAEPGSLAGDHPQAVPEPGSLSLLAVGALGLLRRQRRGKTQRPRGWGDFFRWLRRGGHPSVSNFLEIP